MKKYKSLIIDYIISFLVLIALNFFLPRLLKGDPINSIISSEVSAFLSIETIEKIKSEYGLNKPLYNQFLDYIIGIFHLDFGYSFHYKTKVKDLILSNFKWTILIVSISSTITLIFSYLLAIETNFSKNKKWDRYVYRLIIFLSGFPQFFIGIILLLIFSISLKALPLGGAETIFSDFTGIKKVMDVSKHLILPVTTIIISEISIFYLPIRSSLYITKKNSYISTGISKGLEDSTIKHRYLGKNTVIPLLHMSATMLGKMFVGVIMIETVFSYPGIGNLVYSSITTRDYPVIQGALFLITIIILLLNLFAELIYLKFNNS